MTEATRDIPDLQRLKIDRSGKKRRRRGSKWPALLVVCALVGGGYWWWDRQKKPEVETKSTADEGPRVVTAELWRADKSSAITANGYVIARRRAALSTVLSGRLVEINVEEGSTVEEGEVVARIQFDDYASALVEAERRLEAARSRLDQARQTTSWQEKRVAQAEADMKVVQVALEGAKTDLAEAERDRERNQINFKKGVINEAEWDRVATKALRMKDLLNLQTAQIQRNETMVAAARAEVETSRAGIKIAEQELATAEAARDSAALLLEKTYVRAPFAGVIVDKGAEEGEVVAATGAGGNSRGSVATVVDLATLEIQVELPETRLGTIRDEQRVEIFLDVEPERAWPGQVRQIWPTADRGKGTVEIRATFLERPEVLRPEMGARVVFLPEQAGEPDLRLVSLPSTSVKKDGEVAYVLLVRNRALERRDIEIHERNGSKTLVKSGVVAGDKILDRPGTKFRAGDSYND